MKNYSRQAIAADMVMKRKKKMFKGGEVDPDFDSDARSDFDQDADRSLGELAIQGAFRENEISNPESQDEDQMLARALFRRSEAHPMGYAEGGLVQPEHGMPDGNKPDEDMRSDTEEPLSSMPPKPAALGHSVVDGVPMSPGVSAEAMRAIEEKRKRRRFM